MPPFSVATLVNPFACSMLAAIDARVPPWQWSGDREVAGQIVARLRQIAEKQMPRIRDVSSVPLSGAAYVDHRPVIASGDVRRLELIDARQSIGRRPIGANVPPGPSDDPIEANEREHPPRILDASPRHRR